MSLRRFYINKEFIKGNKAILEDKDEIRHLSRVLRLKEGDQIILFDGEGHEYPAKIMEIKKREVSLELQPNSSFSVGESPLQIILGIGLLKGSKFDWLIQKLTELGVAEIIPFYSQYSIPRWPPKDSISKKERWEKIALAAAKQCGRTKIPIIHPPCSFAEVLRWPLLKGALKIFIWEREKNISLAQAASPSSQICALVGPEGGFSAAETDWACAAGFQPVHLGPRILRAETAGIIVVALLQFLYGDLK